MRKNEEKCFRALIKIQLEYKRMADRWDIQHETGLSSSTVSKCMNLLKEQGLVAVSPMGRSMYLLTEKGRDSYLYAVEKTK